MKIDHPYVRLLIDTDEKMDQRLNTEHDEYTLYNGYISPIYWIPMLNQNLAIFYGEEEQKLEFLKTFSVSLLKNLRSTNVHYYFFDEDTEMREKIGSLKNFKTREYSWGFEKFLDDLIEVRGIIKEDRLKSGYVEAYNRKKNIVIFDLPKVHNKETFLKLYELLKKFRRERIYPIMLAKSAKSIPKQFHSLFDEAIYLGRDNQIICDFVNAGLGYGFYDIQQEHIGTAFVKGSKFLVPVHPIEYTRSEWGENEQRELDEEYEEYLEFLKTLRTD